MMIENIECDFRGGCPRERFTPVGGCADRLPRVAICGLLSGQLVGQLPGQLVGRLIDQVFGLVVALAAERLLERQLRG
jgi:hypothetical protein